MKVKNFKSPLIYLVWSVLRLSGFVSLCVSPKAAAEGAPAPLVASLPRLKPRCASAGLGFSAALLIEVSLLSCWLCH